MYGRKLLIRAIMAEEYISTESNLYIQLRIYVIGFYPQGECILLIVFDTSKNKVVKSIAVDCYIENNRKQFIEILQKYKISKTNPLDLIIWTHPDNDHSKGIDKMISNYANNKTIIVTPDGMNIWTMIRANTFTTYLMVLYYAQKSRIVIERVNNSNNRKFPDEYLPLYLSDGILDDLHFSVEILTPHADSIIKKTEINKTFKNNDISISFIVHFGAMNFYFGGDVENGAINKINKYRLANLSYIKIPHHGSNTSNKFPAVIEEMNLEREDDDTTYVTSVVTSYNIGKSNLPNDDVLNMYNNISNAIVKTDSAARQYQYGMHTINYNILAKSISNSQCFGDANIWYERV